MTRRIPLPILAPILLGILAFAFLAVLAVVIDERCSRHESTWTDGGGRHIEEMLSEKVSGND